MSKKTNRPTPRQLAEWMGILDGVCKGYIYCRPYDGHLSIFSPYPDSETFSEGPRSREILQEFVIAEAKRQKIYLYVNYTSKEIEAFNYLGNDYKIFSFNEVPKLKPGHVFCDGFMKGSSHEQKMECNSRSKKAEALSLY